MKRASYQTHLVAAALAPLLLLALSACSTKKGGGADGSDGAGYDSPYGPGAGGAYDDMIGATPLPSRNENVSFSGPGSENVDRELFTPVYFAFDDSTVRSTEMSKVDAVAEYMKSTGGGASVIVGGFTDTIGSEEYNRQLGEFRALAVRSTLLSRGIHPNRVQTVSFGEDLPAVHGGSASEQAVNRRAEFGIVR